MQNTNTQSTPQAVTVPTLYSRPEAAKILKIGLRNLDYLVSRGDLDVTRIGQRTLIPAWALVEFISRNTTRRGKYQVH